VEIELLELSALARGSESLQVLLRSRRRSSTLADSEDETDRVPWKRKSLCCCSLGQRRFFARETVPRLVAGNSGSASRASVAGYLSESVVKRNTTAHVQHVEGC